MRRVEYPTHSGWFRGSRLATNEMFVLFINYMILRSLHTEIFNVLSNKISKQATLRVTGAAKTSLRVSDIEDLEITVHYAKKEVEVEYIRSVVLDGSTRVPI